MSKTCIIECTDNLSTKKITVKETKKQNGTTVSFIPDYERFGVTELPKGNLDSLMFELLHLGITYPGITFSLNKEKIKVKNFKDYCSYYGETFVNSESKGLKLVILPNETDNFKFVHFVNSLNVFNGGEINNWVTDKIVSGIFDKLINKHKGIKKGDIKNKLFVVSIFDGIFNPRFGDQIKSICTNKYKDFQSQIEEPEWDKIVQKILKTPEIIDPIVEVYKLKEELKKRQEMKGLEKTKKKIKSEKFMPPIGEWTNLFLAEGDSAANSISKILGRKGNGFFAMFGVPPNAYITDVNELLKSPKITDLRNIINLKLSTTTQENINFKNIILTTDFDLPGHFIAGQLLGLFARFGANLFDEGRIKRFITPMMVAKDSKDKIVTWFYSFDSYRTYESNSSEKLSYEYKKGLGSWDSEELNFIIEAEGMDQMLEVFSLDEVSKKALDNWLLTSNADKRKEMLNGYEFNIMGI